MNFSAIVRLTQRVLRARGELVWVAIGQIAALGGAFAGIKILTNALGAEKYGELALGLTISGLVNLFVYGPISQWVLRFFSIYRERGKLRVFYYTLGKVYVLATIGVFAGSIAVLMILAIFLDREWILLLTCASLFAVAVGINTLFISLQSAVRERRIVALHQGADAWFRPVLALGALYLFGDTSYFVLLGFFSGTLLVTTSQALCTRRSLSLAPLSGHPGDRCFDWKEVRGEFFDYVMPFGFFALFGAISLYGDRWLLQGMFGEREVGVYTALYQVANAPVTLLVGFLGQLMTPVIFDRAGTMETPKQAERSRWSVYEAVAIASTVMAGMIVVAYFFGWQLAVFFTGPEFAQHHDILWILVFGLCLFNIGQFLALQGFSGLQTRRYIWPKGIQSASFLVFAYAFASLWGVTGVAIALALSSLVYLVLVIGVNRRLGVRSA